MPESHPINTTSQIVVLDGEIFGEPIQTFAEDHKNSINRLAEISGLRLLGIDFGSNASGEQLFMSATALPDIRLGGEALLDALMAVLE
jgi:hypothetical protein